MYKLFRRFMSLQDCAFSGFYLILPLIGFDNLSQLIVDDSNFECNELSDPGIDAIS